MRRLDELHLKYPVYGSRKLGKLLEREGWVVNRKRVMRLLQVMGIEAIYQKPKTSEPSKGHRIYPYLLKGLEINGPDQVWCSDITYIPLQQGFMYLVAVMDWWSRYVLAWEDLATRWTATSASGLGNGHWELDAEYRTSQTPIKGRSSRARRTLRQWNRQERR
jgi:transposase InsO family protein